VNRHVLRALLQDALYQVLDDKVFRLLVLVSIVLVAPTFLIGVRPDGLHLLFGWRTYTYEELFSAFGGRGVPRVAELDVYVVRATQDFIVQGLAGSVGMLFCIAATAFFVPRMLEKGAADTLFSRPVGRFTLLFARYASGVLFVGCLSFLLVLGMHLGFRLVSGWSDPAFLWSALTLTYVFALVHCVSVTVAVFTRSSIAAILCTLLFFAFNGCVQQSWIVIEHSRAVEAERAALGEEAEGSGGRFQALLGVVDGMRWALPKTTDADFVVAGLRRAVTGAEPRLSDASGALSVEADPPGFARQGPKVVDLGAERAAWTAQGPDGAETARIELSRRDRRETDSKGRPRLRSPVAAAADLAKSLEKSPTTSDKPVRGGSPASESLQPAWVRWRERGEDADLDRRTGLFGLEQAMYQVEATFRPAFGAPDERELALRRFVEALRVERKSARNQKPTDWYAQEFGWTAPWRHNAFVSIGTSLLFAAALLLLARWRLARIDF
jgi:ABC-type transport system involved in multi-copper enzyme maturation permease subunit